MLEGSVKVPPTILGRALSAAGRLRDLDWPRLFLFNADKREAAFCVLLVSAALFFSPFLLFGYAISANTDLLLESYPSFLLAKHDFLHGSLGLWNPYVYSGIARAAEATPTVLYPEHWFLFLVPARYLFTTIAFFAFVKVWLIGVAAYYFYCAELQNRRWALFAAIAFQLSGMTIWLLSVYVSALSLMLFYIVLLALIWTSGRRGSLANYLLWSTIMTLMLMAGDIALASYALLGVGILFLYRTLSRRQVEPMLGRLALFTASSLTALAIFSVRLFPTLDVMQGSSATGCCTPEFANASFLIARYFDTEILGVHFGSSVKFFQSISPLFHSYHLHWAAPQFFGVAVALLALWALASEKTPKAAFWSVYVIAALALLTYAEPFDLLRYYLLWPIGAAIGMQMLFLVGLPALAALGGMCLERDLRRAGVFPRSSLTFQLLGFAILLIALFLLMILLRNIFPGDTDHEWPRAIVIGLLLFGALVLWANYAYPGLLRAAALPVLASILAGALFVLLFWTDDNLTFLSHLKNMAVQLLLFTAVASVLMLISRGRSNQIRRFGLWGAIILVPLCLFTTLYPWTDMLRGEVSHDKGIILAALGALRFVLGVAALFLAVNLARARKLPARSIYIVMMVLLVAEQVPAGKIDGHMGDNPFYGGQLYPPTLRSLKDTDDKSVDLANYRMNYPNSLLQLQFNEQIFGADNEPCADSNAAYGIRSYGGYIDIMPDRLAQFVRNWAPVRNFLCIWANQTDDRLLDLFAVGYQYDWRSGTIVRRTSALSRFMLFTEFEVASSDKTELQILKDAGFEPREKVVLEAAPGFQSESSSVNGEPLAYRDIDSDDAELHVQTDRPAILLFNDSFDSGWEAKVNNHPQDVMVANYNFMAIPIPAGESDVVLQYKPHAFQIGAICAFAGLMGLGLAFAVYLIRRLANRPKLNIAKATTSTFSVFRRYRVLPYAVLSLTVISVIQIISSGGPFNAATARRLFYYKNYDIVRLGDSYVGVAQDLGPVDVAAIIANKAPRPPATKFIVSNDIGSLQATLDRFPPMIPLYYYKNYRVVRFGASYVGVAQELGPIDVAAIMANTASRPPATQFIVSNDLKSLQAAIETIAEDPVRFLYAYQGYNVVRIGQLYVAADQRLGRIDIRSILKEDFPARPGPEQIIVAHNLGILKASVTYMNVKRLLNRVWTKLHV